MSKFKFKVDILARIAHAIQGGGRPSYRPPTTKALPRMRPTEASVQWEAENGALITEGSCLRAVWYRAKDFPETDDVDARMHWIWALGHWYEAKCQQLTRESGDLARPSVRIRDESFPLAISGELDAVNLIPGCDPDNPRYFLIDYKSTGGYYSGVKLLGNRNHKAFPKIGNLLQLMVYLDHDPRLEFGMLVYLIRDKMEQTQFEIELVKYQVGDSVLTAAKVNGEVCPQYSIQEIKRRYSALCGYYMRNELPPRDYDHVYSIERARQLHAIGMLGKTKMANAEKGQEIGDWVCDYCNFRAQCLKDGA